MTIRRIEAERRARERWAIWRLLLSDMHISWSDLDSMDDDDIAEANAALDIHMKQLAKQSKK
jgi:hypothetical protein